MQPLDSKPINLTGGKKTVEKPAHKRQFPKVLKQYFILLVIVTVIAAIVFGVFMLMEQKRFFRWEASSILCYHPEQISDMIPRLSIYEVQQILRTDTVKQQTGDVVAIPQDKQMYLKEALDISCDSAPCFQNMLKISVKWDDAEQAKQLVDGYKQAAITAYTNFQSNNLLEVIKERNKTKSAYEHQNATIEEKRYKLAQSVHNESVKQALETLRMQEIRLQNELSDLQKQHSLATNQRENLKKRIPSQYDYEKLIIVSQHPYLLDFIQKKDEALENYEIQKTAVAEGNERQGKESQLKYRFAEDRLNKTLENLNLREDDVRSLNTAILKHVEELDSIQVTLDGINKCIEDIQYRLDQKQKEISAVSELLPQEEELNRIHNTTTARLNQIENEITEQEKLITTIKKALIPLNFINVHHVSSFSISNYVSYLLVGIIIIAILASCFILANTHGKRHATNPSTAKASPSTTAKAPPSTKAKPVFSATKDTLSSIKP